MLLRITTKCFEGCPHCLVAACPSGETIDLEDLQLVTQFINLVRPMTVVVTGGELLDIDDLFEYLKVINLNIKNSTTKLIYESNGTWINDEEKCKLVRLILQNPRVALMQISTNEKYYKDYKLVCEAAKKGKYEKISRKIKFVADWQGELTHIHDLGRGKTLLKDDEIKGYPSCSNYMNWIYNAKMRPEAFPDLTALMVAMEIHGKSCTPCINQRGEFVVGEGSDCRSLGSIPELYKEGKTLKQISDYLFEESKKLKFCRKCRQCRNLTEDQLKVLEG